MVKQHISRHKLQFKMKYRIRIKSRTTLYVGVTILKFVLNFIRVRKCVTVNWAPKFSLWRVNPADE